MVASCTIPTCVLFFFMCESVSSLIYPDAGLQLIGIIALFALGMGVQIHMKALARLCIKLSPACYFIYLYHEAVYDLFKFQLLSMQSQVILNDYCWLAAPVIAIVLIAIAYYTIVLLRRFVPCLLPFIVGLKR